MSARDNHGWAGRSHVFKFGLGMILISRAEVGKIGLDTHRAAPRRISHA
jgi:hypothetical protein